MEEGKSQNECGAGSRVGCCCVVVGPSVVEEMVRSAL